MNGLDGLCGECVWNLWTARDLESVGLGTITGILTGISELLDYGSLTLILEFVDLGIITGMLRSWNRKSGVLESVDLGGIAGVFTVLATSVPVGELLQMELQARGLATRGVHMWHTQSEVAD